MGGVYHKFLFVFLLTSFVVINNGLSSSLFNNNDNHDKKLELPKVEDSFKNLLNKGKGVYEQGKEQLDEKLKQYFNKQNNHYDDVVAAADSSPSSSDAKQHSRVTREIWIEGMGWQPRGLQQPPRSQEQVRSVDYVGLTQCRVECSNKANKCLKDLKEELATTGSDLNTKVDNKLMENCNEQYGQCNIECGKTYNYSY